MRGPRLTLYQRRIIAALAARGGSAVCLYRLTLDADLDYANAHRNLCRLEDAGVVLVERPGGSKLGLRMSLARPVPVQLSFGWPISRHWDAP